MRRALVTGANGFIGSHLVERLLDRSCRVRCLVRKTSDLKWLDGLDVEIVTGDLSDPSSLEAAVRDMAWIFHLGGKTKALTREEFFAANAQGTERLLQSAETANSHLERFVYVSSLAAAGPGNGRPLTETDFPKPVTWYGQSKLEGERITLARSPHLPVTVVRPPIVFGPRDTDVLEFFKAVKRGLIPGIGCKDHFAGFVYVEDLCEGLVLAAEKNEALGQTYYLVNEGNCTWKRFGRTVAEALGKTAIPFPVPFVLLALIVFMNDAWARARKRATILNRQKLPEYRARFWGCDGSKAALELGFRPSYTLPQAVVKTGSWYRSMGWL